VGMKMVECARSWGLPGATRPTSPTCDVGMKTVRRVHAWEEEGACGVGLGRGSSNGPGAGSAGAGRKAGPALSSGPDRRRRPIKVRKRIFQILNFK
jgi:hypothetical protein